MAINSAIAPVTTTASFVGSGSSVDNEGGSRLLVTNTGATVVYLGGPGVTAATGYPLAASAQVSLIVADADRLYAISATTGTLAVLSIGV